MSIMADACMLHFWRHSPLRIHTARFCRYHLDKANEIMKDVYNQIILISTIAAVVTAFGAILMMNFSKSGKTVDESRAWLKRIVITWAILNGLALSWLTSPRSLQAENGTDRRKEMPLWEYLTESWNGLPNRS